MQYSLPYLALMDMLTFVMQYPVHEQTLKQACAEFKNRRSALQKFYLQKDPTIIEELETAFSYAERLLHVRFNRTG